MSKLLGFGELTITRYMDGQLPSKKYSDILLEILVDEQKMNRITVANKDLVSSKTAEKVFRAIETNEKEKHFANDSEREKKITDYVLDTFGIYNAWFLMELTHVEEPWKSARGNLDDNDVYNLKQSAGVNSYVNALTTKVLS